jgi:hypothetical protein
MSVEALAKTGERTAEENPLVRGIYCKSVANLTIGKGTAVLRHAGFRV